jgi:predicted RNA-binding protein with TRAM domain
MTESKPISVGDEIEVTIEACGKKGDGIAKIENFVVFVANAQEGKSYKVKVTKVLSKVSFADIVGEGDAPAVAPVETAKVEAKAEEVAAVKEIIAEKPAEPTPVVEEAKVEEVVAEAPTEPVAEEPVPVVEAKVEEAVVETPAEETKKEA